MSLREAAVESLVAHSVSTNVWLTMAKEANLHPNSWHKNMQETEDYIKKEYEVKRMPNAWTSAKSVINSALSLNVHLTDSNGNYLGKTAVQVLIKQAKGSSPEDIPSKMKAALDYIVEHLDVCPEYKDLIKVH